MTRAGAWQSFISVTFGGGKTKNAITRGRCASTAEALSVFFITDAWPLSTYVENENERAPRGKGDKAKNELRVHRNANGVLGDERWGGKPRSHRSGFPSVAFATSSSSCTRQPKEGSRESTSKDGQGGWATGATCVYVNIVCGGSPPRKQRSVRASKASKRGKRSKRGSARQRDASSFQWLRNSPRRPQSPAGTTRRAPASDGAQQGCARQLCERLGSAGLSAARVSHCAAPLAVWRLSVHAGARAAGAACRLLVALELTHVPLRHPQAHAAEGDAEHHAEGDDHAGLVLGEDKRLLHERHLCPTRSSTSGASGARRERRESRATRLCAKPPTSTNERMRTERRGRGHVLFTVRGRRVNAGGAARAVAPAAPSGCMRCAGTRSTRRRLLSRG
eukprot:7383180-Prymnesium_polylepis.2